MSNQNMDDENHPKPHSKSSLDNQMLGSAKESQQYPSVNRRLTRKSTFQLAMEQPLSSKIEAFLESYQVTIFMSLITLFALFGDDVRILSTDKDGDSGFWVVTIICIVFFSLEIIMSSIVKENYFLGFFFWLDILSTVSMLLDVGWISDGLFGTSGNGAVSAVQLARAGRASRVGTRASRIVRVVRLIRLSKLYKHAKQTLEKEAQRLLELENEQNEQEQQRMESQQQIEQQDPPSPRSIPRRASGNSQVDGNSEPRGQRASISNRDSRRKLNTQLVRSSQTISSGNRTILRQNSKMLGGSSKQNGDVISETQIGKLLTELTNKRVITIVMLILFSVPIFTLSTYREDYQSYDTGLASTLYWKDKNTEVYNLVLQDYVDYHSALRVNLIYLKVSDVLIYPTDSNDEFYYETLRTSALTFYSASWEDIEGIAIANGTGDEELNAILSIVRTIFVSIVLSTAAVLFSKDVQDLVLTPVERMLETVKRIAENPLKAANEEENQAFIQLTQNTQSQNLIEQEDGKLETVILQKLIIKIGALLAIGFGEAGSEIIAKNMGNNSGVDPMLPGKKMMAIFGFCDIRNFTDATEVLQQDVMVFVNEIAAIVHGIVDQYSGSANKNIGDAFLLVWKFQDTDFITDSQGNLELKPYDHIAQTADMAILAFATIITSISTSPNCLKYKSHEGLNARIPNYSVKMGFGLHCGWAIEGAIGSEYKIDASYLSPNVNMASRLEAATKQFGSWLLISGQLRNISTRQTQAHLRHIDRVTVKGSIEPIDLYTVDINLDALNIKQQRKQSMIQVPAIPIAMDEMTKKKNKVIRRMKRDKLKTGIMKNTIRIAEEWDKNHYLKQVRAIFTEQFYQLWNKGFQEYLSGDWENSKKTLDQTLTMLPNYRDGPSNTLLRVMREEAYLKNNWKGFRELTEK